MPSRRRPEPSASAHTASAPGSKPKPSRPGSKGTTATATERAFARLGLLSPLDFALHLPLRHDDETRLSDWQDDLLPGATVQLEAIVRSSRIETRARRILVVDVVPPPEADAPAGAALSLRFLNFYPSQVQQLQPGVRLRLRGEVRGGLFGLEMLHPVWKRIEAGAPLPATLTPVYPAAAPLTQAVLRRAIAGALKLATLQEVLPPGTVPHGLPSLAAALELLHHPGADVDADALAERSHPAWQRLKFDELLAQQLSQRRARLERARHAAPRLPALAGGLTDALLAALPFELTGAQQRVGAEIAADLARPHPAPPADVASGQAALPMHRLLQGDVGSGKTVVAALAAALAIEHGWQAVLMAPTELLAEQHFGKLRGWLEPLLAARGCAVAWLSGSQKGSARRAARAAIADGSAALIVGTHAVIQDGVDFARLGLAIVDEQHRFGVAQRLALRRKLAEGSGGLEPHLLMMSATPIPRTLAMACYADLDLSTLDELPPGRSPIVTRVFEHGKREEVIERVGQAVEAGRQVYWVCPLIEESEAIDLENATATAALLAETLPAARVGLLHGRMAAQDKQQVMDAFARQGLDVLVATTVIEVGVDVPNASLMVIEHAERFGLAQLHQLRGRIGRGAVASTCVLLYQKPLSAEGRERLRTMAETQDGFLIAQRDMEIRGPGEWLGLRQSGDALLRFADLAHDGPLLQAAQTAADELLRLHPQAADAHLERWFSRRAEYGRA